ncbi:MAG: CRTAC1 family protein [Rhodothermales bacterium]|nr:CRTAC1 family protein [Rhodothermales bacterium]
MMSQSGISNRVFCSVLLLVTLTVFACERASKQNLLDSGEAMTLPFVDATPESGLGVYVHETGAEGKFWFPESMGPGLGIIDYDGNGLPDILVAGGGKWSGSDWNSVWLFRNDGGLQFSDVTQSVGLAGSDSYSMGVVVADYDGDGLEDFLLTSLQGVSLYRNEGGSFTDRTAEAGLSIDSGWSTSSTFFDADQDGDLDLLVGHYVDWSQDGDLWCSNDGTDKTYCTPTIYDGEPLRFYRNERGVFENATGEMGFATGSGKTLGVVAGDLYGSSQPDVYVANDTEPDQLFVADASGRFDDVGLRVGIAYDERGRARAGMGVDYGVIDESGIPSLVVGNFAEEMIGVYQRLGTDVFVDRSAALRIGLPSLKTLTFGLALVDVNLDGHLDLVAANGHIQPEIGRIRDNVTYAEPPHVFVNRGDGSFADVVSADMDLAEPMVARGMSYADLDRDGDPDVLFVENSGGLRLWKNESVEKGRVGAVIDLRDRRENVVRPSTTLGSTIEVFSGGNRMIRWVKSGGSYMSSNESAAHFGWTEATKVDSIRIRWPDGEVQVEDDLVIEPFMVIDRKNL